MGHYKFLDPEHAHFLLTEGTVRFGALSYYRELERSSGDQWIGDRLEGTTEINCSDEVSVAGDSPEARLISPWIKLGKGASITLSNVSFSSPLPDMYIFCVSWGDPERLAESIASSPLSSKYRSYVRVKNLRRLASSVFSEGMVLEKKRPVRELFSGVATGLVRYGEVSTDIRDGRRVRPSPFLKAEKFRSQSEARIVLRPIARLKLQTLTIQIPNPSRLFSSKQPCTFKIGQLAA